MNRETKVRVTACSPFGKGRLKRDFSRFKPLKSLSYLPLLRGEALLTLLLEKNLSLRSNGIDP
jgi:hypothetical protein